MRKFAIIICFIILTAIIGTQCADHIRYKKEKTMLAASDDIVPEDEISKITVTAVGDCTFGADLNLEGSLSFNSEFKRQNNDYSYFLRNVKSCFEDDDLTIANLEGTLSDKGTRAEKEYAFRGNPEYVNILTSSSVEAVNLANNHSRDYGEISLTETKKNLSDNEIIWFEGNNYALKEINGLKVGLIGTNTQRSGEAVFLKRLEALKSEKPDLIVASFHWGDEKAEYPNNLQTKLARLAIDNGTDLVIGHHPHVLQGIEKYRDKYILYSLGNFCFGGNKNPGDKDTAIFKQTFVFRNGRLTAEGNTAIIPCSVSSVKERNNYQPTPVFGEDFLRVRKKIAERSQDFEGIEDIEFIEKRGS